MLPADEVRVVRVDLERGDWGDPTATLSTTERERATRFRHEADRQQYLRSHTALRKALGEALAKPGHEVTLTLGPNKKPEIEGLPLRFSLTHSGGLALIAIAHRAVGVDVELVQPDADPGLARYLSPAERAALASVPAVTHSEAFFRTWVRKEAVLKARGTGLLAPLEDFDVTVGPSDQPRVIATRPDPTDAQRWWLSDLPVAAGYVAAVAVDGMRNEVVLVDA